MVLACYSLLFMGQEKVSSASLAPEGWVEGPAGDLPVDWCRVQPAVSLGALVSLVGGSNPAIGAYFVGSWAHIRYSDAHFHQTMVFYIRVECRIGIGPYRPGQCFGFFFLEL